MHIAISCVTREGKDSRLPRHSGKGRSASDRLQQSLRKVGSSSRMLGLSVRWFVFVFTFQGVKWKSARQASIEHDSSTDSRTAFRAVELGSTSEFSSNRRSLLDGINDA